jgi:hypothetical protein
MTQDVKEKILPVPSRETKPGDLHPVLPPFLEGLLMLVLPLWIAA